MNKTEDDKLLGRRDADRSSKICTEKTRVSCLAAGDRGREELCKGKTLGCLAAGLRIVVADEMYRGLLGRAPGCRSVFEELCCVGHLLGDTGIALDCDSATIRTDDGPL